jgi:putative membrane protein
MVAAVGFPAWHLHPDVIVLMVAIEAVYLWAVSPRRFGGVRIASHRQIAAFSGGVLALWVASDWPVHDLAEGYLYSVHMVQHLLMTLVAAPLLLAGTPAALARRLLARRRALTSVRALSRPMVGLVQFNLVLVLSHWPMVVDATLRHHPLHFVAHAVLLLSALLMWMPVVSPLPEVPRARPPVQMLYLFLQTILPTVPASFLTFGAHPLYHFYETVPRLWGISARSDQQVAGLIMKLVGGLYLWSFIGVIFFRWYGQEEAEERVGHELPEVLLWEDVERELRQLER